jgi:hypothetical protein
MANTYLTTDITTAVAETQMLSDPVRCAMPEHMLPRFKCVLCKKKSVGYGNNPAPIKNKGQCCDNCNMRKVIPARFAGLF